MPIGIFLFDLDESLTPNVIVDFYLEQVQVSPEILKELSEMHLNKGFSQVVHKEEDLVYFSRIIEAESINIKYLFLGVILKKDEDLISLKSIVENNEQLILQKLEIDERKVVKVLKGIIDSIFSLLEKLKEPKLIKDIINRKAKELIDDGHAIEAKELIDLGEKIPEKLAQEIKFGEELLQDKLYKKASKRFSKAAAFSSQIREEEIASFLEKKAQQYNDYPNFLKEKDLIYKDIINISNEFKREKLAIYDKLIALFDRLINLSNKFEKVDIIDTLIKLKLETYGAVEIAADLSKIEKTLKENIDNFKL